MVQFEVNGKKGNYVFNLPTSIKELDLDYLKDITSNVNIADNYVLVGILHREKLSTLILSYNQRKNQVNTAVVPILVKAGACENEYIKSINEKDILIISRGDIELGQHVSIPSNVLNINNLLSCIEGDSTAFKRAQEHTAPVYFLEFKIIPAVNIRGNYSGEATNVTSKYMTKVED